MKYPRPLEQEMVYYDLAHTKHFNLAISLLERFRGIEVDPFDFPHTKRGLGQFLRALKIKHFSVNECTTPRLPARAKRVGYTTFVPPQCVWPHFGLTIVLNDEARKAVGHPVALKNAWRPFAYNRLVAKSGIDSDHPNGVGTDSHYATPTDRAKAEGFLRGLQRTEPGLLLSLGMGYKNLHIGVLSPNGSRCWWYSNYPKREAKVKL